MTSKVIDRLISILVSDRKLKTSTYNLGRLVELLLAHYSYILYCYFRSLAFKEFWELKVIPNTRDPRASSSGGLASLR